MVCGEGEEFTMLQKRWVNRGGEPLDGHKGPIWGIGGTGSHKLTGTKGQIGDKGIQAGTLPRSSNTLAACQTTVSSRAPHSLPQQLGFSLGLGGEISVVVSVGVLKTITMVKGSGTQEMSTSLGTLIVVNQEDSCNRHQVLDWVKSSTLTTVAWLKHWAGFRTV